MAAERVDRVLDAAIAVLGAQGPRRLTHRAVDAAAGLPAGSTSNYFRTRDALVDGIVARIEALERQEWEALAGQPRPMTVDELTGALTRLLHHATGPAGPRTTARHALFLEAAARPELRPALTRSRDAITAWATAWIAALGSRRPEVHCRLVLDYLDGVILHQLAFPDPAFDPAPAVRALLAGLLSP